MADRLFVADENTTSVLINIATGASASFGSGYSSRRCIGMAGQFYQRAVACFSASDGYGDNALVIGDGSGFAFRGSPPAAPTLTINGAGGAMTAGDHWFALSVSWADGSEGPLGEPVKGTVVSGGSVDVNWTQFTLTEHYAIAGINVWATGAGDPDVFRRVVKVARNATTYNVFQADETLQGFALDDYRSRIRTPKNPALGVMYAGRMAYFGEKHRSVGGWRSGGSQGTDFGMGIGPATTGTPGGWTVTAGAGVGIAVGQCRIVFDGAAATPGRLLNVGTVVNDLPGIASLTSTGWSGAFGIRCTFKRTAGLTNASLKYGVAGTTGGTLTTVDLAPLTADVYYTSEMIVDDAYSTDLKLTFEAVGPGVNGESVYVALIECFDPKNTSHRSTIWWARPYEFRSIDGLYGPQTFGADDSQTVWLGWEWQGRFYIAKDYSVWVTQKTDGDPIDWPVEKVSELAGACGRRAIGHGPDFKILVNRAGAWLFQGSGVGPENLLSKEIPTEWAAINWTEAWQTWVAVDEIQHRVYIGVPTGVSTYCDKVYVLDYRGGFGPATETGGRRWSVWPLEARGGTMGLRANSTVPELWISRTNAGSGQIGYLDSTVSQDWTTTNIPWRYETGRIGSDDGSLGLFRRLTLVIEGSGLVVPSIVTTSGTVKTLPSPTLYTPMRGTQHLLCNVTDDRIGLRFATAGAGAKALLHRLSLWMRRNPFGDYRPRTP